MGVFTFVCKESGSEWSAKQLNGDLEASGDCVFTLQRNLVHAALAKDSSGGVQSSFSYVTPTSAVFQVIVGSGAVGGSFVAAAAAAPGADQAPAAAAAEEKKKEEIEEESDEDIGLGLFDEEY